PPQRHRHLSAIRLRRGIQGDVGTVDTRSHDLLDGVIPAVTGVFVLTLRPDVSDLVLYLIRGPPGLSLPAVVARLMPGRRRPHGSGNELEELSLAGAIRAGQHPPLAGADGPAHLLEHLPSVALEANLLEMRLDV